MATWTQQLDLGDFRRNQDSIRILIFVQLEVENKKIFGYANLGTYEYREHKYQYIVCYTDKGIWELWS